MENIIFFFYNNSHTLLSINFVPQEKNLLTLYLTHVIFKLETDINMSILQRKNRGRRDYYFSQVYTYF